MPKRTNTFQREVLAVASEAAGEARLEESPLVADLITGSTREVDITVDGAVAGHEVRIGIECRAAGRPADVTWVEQMKAKHDRLPTNVLVLVSRSGFTPEAKRLAAVSRIQTWTLAEMQQAVRRRTMPPRVSKAAGVSSNAITIREYAFVQVGELVGPYRSLLDLMLQDKGLSDSSRLGILMCTQGPEAHSRGDAIEWTVFVEPAWLRWVVEGSKSGYGLPNEAPAGKVYGQIPSWPDSFIEFLQAMVLTNTTFTWRRHPDGYLVLSQ